MDTGVGVAVCWKEFNQIPGVGIRGSPSMGRRERFILQYAGAQFPSPDSKRNTDPDADTAAAPRPNDPPRDPPGLPP
jgi:hypothetical protein